MIEFVLDYMEQKGYWADAAAEQERLEQGIRLWLSENGISETATGEYYKKYVKDYLEMIAPQDLKSYFCCYPVISEIHQIAIEQKTDGSITEERRRRLYGLMKELHQSGLGEKYVPIQEVKAALGGFS
ncbi:MAG: hypothetical protein Q4C50_05080 [Eubacteriales bacterium]|nr:hypothetical protein [Eubacteriales bacterium]